MSKQTFHIGGIHPADKKISRDCAIEALPIPPTVYISLSQHIGAPAKPIVAVGDKVKTGQPVAEPGGFVSAWIHSSVSGTVKSIGPRKDLSGKSVPSIEIAVEGDEWIEGVDLSDTLVTEFPEDNKAIMAKSTSGGIVGLGGATFPTHVKLSPPPGQKCERLIINGCECEPYLTCNYRYLLERGEQVAVGVAILMQVLGVKDATIAIEDNKPEDIAHMKDVVAKLAAKSDKFRGIEIMPMMTKYPEGGEKQLIDAVMNRQVASGGLPISVGAVVQNVATAYAVYEAVQKNKPLVSNTLTYTGDCVATQHNYEVRVGTPLSFIIECAGGMPQDAAKVISGGPMMGRAVANLDAATVKGTSGLLFLTAAQTKRAPATACIRCGSCADACPMGLEPFLLKRLALAGDLDGLEQNAMQDCISCGSCQYSCPASIPLLDIMTQGKAKVMGVMKARAAAAKAAAEAKAAATSAK